MEELEQLKQKTEEYLNGWKRERADFLNYKKDEMERIGQMIKYANEEIILKLLPVLDNLLLAQAHINDEGLAQVIKQFQDLLQKEGIEHIEVLGKQFDANTMEATEEISKEALGGPTPQESGVVVEEVQRGYTLHGKLIRPAKVRIAK
jgi:molecular chaperone GrpE